MLYLEYFLSISISRSLDIAAFVKLLNFIYLFILENHYVYSHSGYLVYGEGPGPCSPHPLRRGKELKYLYARKFCTTHGSLLQISPSHPQPTDIRGLTPSGINPNIIFPTIQTGTDFSSGDQCGKWPDTIFITNGNWMPVHPLHMYSSRLWVLPSPDEFLSLPLITPVEFQRLSGYSRPWVATSEGWGMRTSVANPGFRRSGVFNSLPSTST